MLGNSTVESGNSGRSKAGISSLSADVRPQSLSSIRSKISSGNLVGASSKQTGGACSSQRCGSAPIRAMTLKLKRTPGLYLVGFMAAGKSTIGLALADQLGWHFADIDTEIEFEQGVSIAQIFEQQGEPAFRDLETATIRRHVNAIRSGIPTVVALGGGAFVQPRNWDLLENNGVTIWLDCPFEVVRRRLNGDQTRPLARDRARLEKLFGDRLPLYTRADFRVEITSDNTAGIVEEILGLPIF